MAEPIDWTGAFEFDSASKTLELHGENLTRLHLKSVVSPIRYLGVRRLRIHDLFPFHEINVAEVPTLRSIDLRGKVTRLALYMHQNLDEIIVAPGQLAEADKAAFPDHVTVVEKPISP